MGELYVEGVATRDGPEPCVDDPRGRGEALDRGTYRAGYRAAKWESGVPTLYKRRKATPSVALSRVAGGATDDDEPGRSRAGLRTIWAVDRFNDLINGSRRNARRAHRWSSTKRRADSRVPVNACPKAFATRRC
jgi:hypothetical protein